MDVEHTRTQLDLPQIDVAIEPLAFPVARIDKCRVGLDGSLQLRARAIEPFHPRTMYLPWSELHQGGAIHDAVLVFLEKQRKSNSDALQLLRRAVAEARTAPTSTRTTTAASTAQHTSLFLGDF